MLDLALDLAEWDAWAGYVRGLDRALGRELRAAQFRIGSRLSQEARRILQREIYALPIPTSGKTGKPKWARHEDLLKAETFKVTSDGAGGWTVRLVNDCPHASARAALGQANPPNEARRKAGIQRDQSHLPPSERSRTRPVLWQEQAVAENERLIEAEYIGAMERARRAR